MVLIFLMQLKMQSNCNINVMQKKYTMKYQNDIIVLYK